MKTLRVFAFAALLGLGILAAAQTDPSKPMRLRISSGLAEKMKIHDVQPGYPMTAREHGIEGDVILLATIDRQGKVSNLRVSEGNPILADAAVGAVKHWKYKPYLLNGEPVEVETTVKVRFHMRH
jgi:periplasmic protein TonB